MRRKPLEIRFDEEASVQAEALKAQISQQVPLSMSYTLGPRPTLVSIDRDRATLLFPDGGRLENVPLRSLVDDSGYWKRCVYCCGPKRYSCATVRE